MPVGPDLAVTGKWVQVRLTEALTSEPWLHVEVVLEAAKRVQFITDHRYFHSCPTCGWPILAQIPILL